MNDFPGSGFWILISGFVFLFALTAWMKSWMNEMNECLV